MTVRDIYKPEVLRCDIEATKRSIRRYLRRYEVEWGRSIVSVQRWEMAGCAPPEENRAVMTDPRVDRAFRELLAEGVVERKRRRVTDSYSYFLTPQGRAATPYEPTPSCRPTETSEP